MASRVPCQCPIRPRGEKGFALLEFVVTVSVFLIVLFTIYLFYEVGQATTARGTTDIDLQDNGRRALDEVAALTRMAGYDPSDGRIFGFKSPTGFTAKATESIVLFSLDADEDGVLDNNTSERVGFGLFGTELKRTMDGTTAVAGLPPIARNVQSVTFLYFDKSDVAIPNPAVAPYTLDATQREQIRRVTMRLALSDTAVLGQGPRVYTVSTDLRPRNLLDP